MEGLEEGDKVELLFLRQGRNRRDVKWEEERSYWNLSHSDFISKITVRRGGQRQQVEISKKCPG